MYYYLGKLGKPQSRKIFSVFRTQQCQCFSESSGKKYQAGIFQPLLRFVFPIYVSLPSIFRSTRLPIQSSILPTTSIHPLSHSFIPPSIHFLSNYLSPISSSILLSDYISIVFLSSHALNHAPICPYPPIQPSILPSIHVPILSSLFPFISI